MITIICPAMAVCIMCFALIPFMIVICLMKRPKCQIDTHRSRAQGNHAFGTAESHAFGTAESHAKSQESHAPQPPRPPLEPPRQPVIHEGICPSVGCWKDIGTLTTPTHVMILQGKHHPHRRHRFMYRALTTHLNQQISLSVHSGTVDTSDSDKQGSPGLNTGDVVYIPQMQCSAEVHTCESAMYIDVK